MNKNIISLSLIIIGFFTNVSAVDSYFLELKKKIEKKLIKNNSIYAESESFIVRSQEDENEYVLRVNGKGQYDKYKEALWNSEAVIRVEDSSPSVERSVTKVYVQDELVFQSNKDYDYKRMEVTVVINKYEEGVKIDKTYDIKGKVCDDVTMVHMFHKMIAVDDSGQKERFYLITNEPKLYHVVVKNRGQDYITIKDNKVLTDKYQLMADLKALTELASKVVPPTYIWVSKQEPIDWVQYQGMDSGYGSANINVLVANYEPKLQNQGKGRNGR
jgi:hypothetical protein